MSITWGCRRPSGSAPVGVADFWTMLKRHSGGRKLEWPLHQACAGAAKPKAIRQAIRTRFIVRPVASRAGNAPPITCGQGADGPGTTDRKGLPPPQFRAKSRDALPRKEFRPMPRRSVFLAVAVVLLPMAVAAAEKPVPEGLVCPPEARCGRSSFGSSQVCSSVASRPSSSSAGNSATLCPR
jgi:hypothetical protein